MQSGLCIYSDLKIQSASLVRRSAVASSFSAACATRFSAMGNFAILPQDLTCSERADAPCCSNRCTTSSAPACLPQATVKLEAPT